MNINPNSNNYLINKSILKLEIVKREIAGTKKEFIYRKFPLQFKLIPTR